MEIAKVTSKGQVTIPLMIRNLLRIKTGDKIFFEEHHKCFFGYAHGCSKRNERRSRESRI